jgi:hypothetical protein
MSDQTNVGIVMDKIIYMAREILDVKRYVFYFGSTKKTKLFVELSAIFKIPKKQLSPAPSICLSRIKNVFQQHWMP